MEETQVVIIENQNSDENTIENFVPSNEQSFNMPRISGIGSLFAGANIGSGANITINFNSKEYKAWKCRDTIEKCMKIIV